VQHSGQVAPNLLSLGVKVPPQVLEFRGTSVLVAVGGRCSGSISVEDQVRPDATDVVKTLETMNIRVILLTGDAQSGAETVADQLGIIHFHADLLPEQKAIEVAAHTKKGRIVAMLGDGINDAPPLIEATVGVAMGSGTDVARESADVVLIGNDLEKVVETVRIARRRRSIIFQNFYGTLIVDAIEIGLAAAGVLNPLRPLFMLHRSSPSFLIRRGCCHPAEIDGSFSFCLVELIDSGPPSPVEAVKRVAADTCASACHWISQEYNSHQWG
jgi:P-type Cu+ transporter